MSLPTVLSSAGRLAARPFVLAVILVYAASFLSQVLLSAPVTSRLDVFPFALVQALLIWLWIALHMRRLHDAGRAGGLAVGIASIYAIEVVLLVLIVWAILANSSPQLDGAEYRLLDFMVILYLLTLMTNDPNLGGLQIWIASFVVLMLLPIVIAAGFSFWAATRPSAPAAP